MNNLIDFYNLLTTKTDPLNKHFDGLPFPYAGTDGAWFINRSKSQRRRALNIWISGIFRDLSTVIKKSKGYSLDEQIALLEYYDGIVRESRTLKSGMKYSNDKDYKHFNGYPEKFASRLINVALRRDINVLRRIRKELK